MDVLIGSLADTSTSALFDSTLKLLPRINHYTVHPPQLGPSRFWLALILTQMAGPQRNRGWASLNNVDAIDLTTSSPETEEHRPNAIPRQSISHQSHTSAYFKRVPRPYVTRVKHEAGQPATSGQTQQARPIDPKHLKEILSTTDPRALHDVLVNLCLASPALSGALVRGIAPYSTAAQGMVHRHLPNFQRPAARPIKDETSADEAYGLMKKRLVTNANIPGHNVTQNPSLHVPNPAGSRATQTAHGPLLVPRIKREYKPGPADSESDDEIRLPGAFPRTSPRASVARQPRQDVPSSSVSANRNPMALPLPQRFTNAEKRLVSVAKTCIQCHETFRGEDEVCMYHAGSKMRDEDGNVVWNCCNEPMDGIGCQFGIHMSEEEANNDTSQCKQPSAPPTPYGSQQKRLRVD
ncbi:hypothetical protein EJ02DRAFT_456727 [Clathrospora elynae]|uniref:Uncharacterized protein n=1 Tax=Clathrospora elynae TaxID=706981 RepID=A0A6A5SIY6_9PLEO|nr:hypothetical protein EJ02DRAFT_456727 [Clathrospora elynae]